MPLKHRPYPDIGQREPLRALDHQAGGNGGRKQTMELFGVDVAHSSIGTSHRQDLAVFG